MKIESRWAALGIAILTSAFALAGSHDLDLDISIRPVFDPATRPTFDVWAVGIRNPGKPTKGILEFRQGGFASTSRIDIPSQPSAVAGTPVFLYIPEAWRSRGERTSISLRAVDGRSAQQQIEGSRQTVQTEAADGLSSATNPNDLVISRSNKMLTGPSTRIMVQGAPENVAAYLPFKRVVLGDQSADLSDRAVDALKDYVVSGGDLLMYPSERGSAVRDSRWGEFLPASVGAPTVRRVSNSFGDKDMRGISPAALPPGVKYGTFSKVVYPLRAVPGAHAWHWSIGGVCAVQKRYGLGTVMIAAQAPDESPSLPPVPPVPASIQPHFQDLPNVNAAGGVFTIPAQTAIKPKSGSASGDPFMIQPPSLLRVVLTLLGYAVAVILAALLGQKFLRKGESAWLTTPILSLGFAGFIFTFAGDLYKAHEARTLAGLLVGDVSTGRALFLGTSQIYLRKGGQRDLLAKDIASLTPVISDQSLSNGPQRAVADAYSSLALEQTPTGFAAPRANIGNLTFLSTRFIQKMKVADWFACDVTVRVVGSLGRANGVFRNNSDFGLEDAAVTVGEYQFVLGKVAPHSTVAVKDALCTRFVGPLPIAQMPDPTNENRIGLEAGMTGLQAGPQVCPVDPNHSLVQVALDLGVGKVVR